MVILYWNTVLSRDRGVNRIQKSSEKWATRDKHTESYARELRMYLHGHWIQLNVFHVFILLMDSITFMAAKWCQVTSWVCINIGQVMACRCLHQGITKADLLSMDSQGTHLRDMWINMIICIQVHLKISYKIVDHFVQRSICNFRPVNIDAVNFLALDHTSHMNLVTVKSTRRLLMPWRLYGTHHHNTVVTYGDYFGS